MIYENYRDINLPMSATVNKNTKILMFTKTKQML